jgi:hypothetical protein
VSRRREITDDEVENKKGSKAGNAGVYEEIAELTRKEMDADEAPKCWAPRRYISKIGPLEESLGGLEDLHCRGTASTIITNRGAGA